MSAALDSIHVVRPASADVHLGLGLVVFVRGSLEERGAGVPAWWNALRSTSFGQRLAYWRRSPEASWAPTDDPAFAHALGARPGQGRTICRLTSFTGRRDGTGCGLEVVDLGPAFGIERASYLRFRPSAPDEAGELAPLASWCLEHLPVWWGAGGWFLERASGKHAGRLLAALAKRFWCAQVLDLSALQWDALRGLPGVNWLTLVGAEFAAHSGMDLQSLSDGASAFAGRGVFHRLGRSGIVLATGPGPIKGDMNLDEAMHGYVAVTQCVEPMILPAPTLSGSLESAELLEAWVRRFLHPHAWLEAEVGNTV